MTVHVADKVMVLEQAGMEAPAVSVVPGKLTFGLNPNFRPPTQRIEISAENPDATVTVSVTEPWVRAMPVKKKAFTYDVQIDKALIPPGRLREAAIRVTAGAAVVEVPVVVERGEPR